MYGDRFNWLSDSSDWTVSDTTYIPTGYGTIDIHIADHRQGEFMFRFNAIYIGKDETIEDVFHKGVKFNLTKGKSYPFEESGKDIEKNKEGGFKREGFLIEDDKRNMGYVNLKHFRAINNSVARELSRRRAIKAIG